MLTEPQSTAEAYTSSPHPGLNKSHTIKGFFFHEREKTGIRSHSKRQTRGAPAVKPSRSQLVRTSGVYPSAPTPKFLLLQQRLCSNTSSCIFFTPGHHQSALRPSERWAHLVPGYLSVLPPEQGSLTVINLPLAVQEGAGR